MGGAGTVSATATSALAVSFSTTTPTVCSVTGNSVSGLAAGTCTIAANQIGDVNYTAAAQVTKGITVAKGSQSITFGAAPAIVVAGSGTVSATAAPGLAVTFTSTTTGVCTVSGSSVKGVTVGTCTIAASQSGNSNYNAAPQIKQTFAIGVGNQTITFGAVPTVVVGKTGTVAATATSGLAPAYSSLTSSTCTISGATVTGVTAGACTIAANQAGNSNYNAAAQATLPITIGRGSQTITFGTSPTIVVGGAGTVSATATSALAVSFSTTTPTVCSVTGNTVTALAAGTCTVAANQVGNANYTAAAQVTKSITIGKAGQTISFGAAPTIAVGGADTVSATATSALAVTYSSSTTSVCTVSGSSVTGVKAGTCTIAANQVGNGDYKAATQVKQSFAISAVKVNQTIVFGTAPVLAVGGTGRRMRSTKGCGKRRAGLFPSSARTTCWNRRHCGLSCAHSRTMPTWFTETRIFWSPVGSAENSRGNFLPAA